MLKSESRNTEFASSPSELSLLDNVYCRLLAEFGVDFSLYEPEVILRRIERRMVACGVDRASQYIDCLRSEDELSCLYKDLLIGVTEFFRDPQAFRTLQTQISIFLAEKSLGNRKFRVWVPGCGTGEEAYSIAILFLELVNSNELPFDLKVIATDLNSDALRVARRGTYSTLSLSNVPAELLRKYFIPYDRGNSFKVADKLRRRVVFAKHDVLRDQQLVQLDLISCRNLLIYLKEAAAARVHAIFNASLCSRGLLMLGPSDPTPAKELGYETLDRDWNIFRSNFDPLNNFGFDISRDVRGRQEAPDPLGHNLKQELIKTKYEINAIREELRLVEDDISSDDANSTRKISYLTEQILARDTLINSAQIGAVQVDNKARVRSFTKSAVDYFRLLPQDIGRPLDHFAHRISDPKMMDRIRSVLETGEGVEREVQNRAGDWLLMRILPYRTEDAEMEGAVVTLVGITQLKEAEKQSEQTMRDLKASNQELQQFAHVVSHDLKAPIRHIHSHCVQLKEELAGQNSDAIELLDRTTSSAKHMIGLIEGLLAYSRVGGGGADMIPTDLDGVFQTVVQQIQDEIDEADAVVVSDPLPTVKGDKIQLIQLFQNLIENALKFRSKERPRVYMAVKPRGRHWVFSIQDNGIGIDPKFAESIFEVFRRLHDSETYSGTGMGLVICRKVVDRHGGRIWLDRRGGMGSTFVFTLPMMDGDSAADQNLQDQPLDQIVEELQSDEAD